MRQMAGDRGGRERPGRVHRRSANWPGEHRLQTDHGSNGDSGCDAFFFRAGGDAEDHEHEQEGENEFQNKGLRICARGHGRAQNFVFWKEQTQYAAGQECSGALAQNVRQNGRAL